MGAPQQLDTPGRIGLIEDQLRDLRLRPDEAPADRMLLGSIGGVFGSNVPTAGTYVILQNGGLVKEGADLSDEIWPHMADGYILNSIRPEITYALIRRVRVFGSGGTPQTLTMGYTRVEMDIGSSGTTGPAKIILPGTTKTFTTTQLIGASSSGGLTDGQSGWFTKTSNLKEFVPFVTFPEALPATGYRVYIHLGLWAKWEKVQ